MTTTVAFTVHGRPCSINATYERRAYQHGGGGLRRSDAAEDYYQRIQAAAVGAFGHVRCPFAPGRIVLEIQPFFTRDSDAGAVGKLVQDALQKIAYVNDREVAVLVDWKGGVDKERPRTEVHVSELSKNGTIVLWVPRLTTPEEDRAALGSILGPRSRERMNRSKLQSSARRYGK
jgi:Holliday junction resolvase RusA-like endonuclease